MRGRVAPSWGRIPPIQPPGGVRARASIDRTGPSYRPSPANLPASPFATFGPGKIPGGVDPRGNAGSGSDEGSLGGIDRGRRGA